VRCSSILVVANRTATSAGLEQALRARADSGPVEFTLLVPLGNVPDAERTATELAAELCATGLDVRACAGVSDPLVAVLQEWSPAKYDEIIVSTLPAWNSRWMKSGLPQRIERHTGALVRHVEARDPLGAVHSAA
jgi:hypothetical protein